MREAQTIGRRIRILAVDDEASARLLLARVLQNAGYDASAVADPLEGLAAVRRGEVDLLIVDKNLPRYDGLELARQAREIDPRLRIMLITAAPEISVDPRSFDAYLEKPFRSLQELQDSVRQALGGGGGR